MAYQSLNTGKQVDLGIDNVVRTSINSPTLFTGVTTTNNPALQELSAGVWKDVNFVDTTFLAQGDFTYVNGILTYVGEKDRTMKVSIACNLQCDTINSVITLSQWKNGVQSTEASNSNKAESNTSRTPFSISNKFDLTNGDEINLRILSSLASNVNMYNFSVTLETLEIIG